MQEFLSQPCSSADRHTGFYRKLAIEAASMCINDQLDLWSVAVVKMLNYAQQIWMVILLENWRRRRAHPKISMYGHFWCAHYQLPIYGYFDVHAVVICPYMGIFNRKSRGEKDLVTILWVRSMYQVIGTEIFFLPLLVELVLHKIQCSFSTFLCATMQKPLLHFSTQKK